jgi:hypothetical protein
MGDMERLYLAGGKQQIWYIDHSKIALCELNTWLAIKPVRCWLPVERRVGWAWQGLDRAQTPYEYDPYIPVESDTEASNADYKSSMFSGIELVKLSCHVMSSLG